MNWLQGVAERVEQTGLAARVVIISTNGPTPKATGTAMLVWGDGGDGHIGRGEAEQRSIEIARAMIAELRAAPAKSGPAWLRRRVFFPTGYVLGKASGGTIEVLVEVFGPEECAALTHSSPGWTGGGYLARSLNSGERPIIARGERNELPLGWRAGGAELAAQPHARLMLISSASAADAVIERLEPARPPFYVYGTGLVARALVKVLAELPFDVIWIDTTPGHFPAVVPVGVTCLPSSDVEQSAKDGQPGAFHAVMTVDHDLDLAVCRQILQRGDFHYLGVIGSVLKRERLMSRLSADGIGPQLLDRLSCPIGLEQIKSKNPAVIAVGIAAQALSVLSPDGSDGEPA